MAKPTYAKMNLKTIADTVTVKCGDQDVEVKQYLPAQKKLELIGNLLSEVISNNENNFINPIQVDILGTLNIIYYYTDIVFTDKQKESPDKIYDTLQTNGIIDTIMREIPSDEYTTITDWIDETTKAYYEYRASALGILEAISTDYSNLNLEASEIQKELADPNNLVFLKDVMTKLG